MLDILDQKINVSVNRIRPIKTLEDKAWALGYSFEVPKGFKEGWKIIKKKTVEYWAYYKLIDLEDFDGTKKIISVRYYENKGDTLERPAPQSHYGLTLKYGASDFHGTESINYNPELLSPRDIRHEFSIGNTIAPGLFDPTRCTKKKSYRSQEALVHVPFINFDGDEWDDLGKKYDSYEEFLIDYPDVESDFFYIGESISSRSPAKPWLNLRLGLLFPEPFPNDPDNGYEPTKFYEQLALHYVQKYPFIATAVAVDTVRLSFGNGRSDVVHEVYPNVMPIDLYEDLKDRGRQQKVKEEKSLFTIEQRRKERKEKSEKRQATEKKLIEERAIEPPPYDYYGTNPLTVFLATVNPRQKLIERQEIFHAFDDYYAWHDTSSVWSLKFNGDYLILPFSNTLNAKYLPPKARKNWPINAHRFLIWQMYKIDYTKCSFKEMDRLLRLLAADGYGIYTDPSVIRDRESEINRVARELGLNVPDAFRPVARIEEDETAVKELQETLTTLESNQESITDFLKTVAKLMVLKAETGAGKTELVLRDKIKKIFVVPTIQLAEEIKIRGTNLKRRPVIWRARDWKFEVLQDIPTLEERAKVYLDEDTPCEAMCIQPDMCQEVTDKGGKVQTIVCQGSCPVGPDYCRYIGQRKIHKGTDISIIPMLDMLLDQNLHAFANEIFLGRRVGKGEESELVMRKDRIVIVDEVSASDLYMERTLTRDQLIAVINRWSGELASEFCGKLLDSFDDPESWRDIVEALTKEEVETINDQLRRWRLKVTNVRPCPYRPWDYIVNAEETGDLDIHVYRHRDDPKVTHKRRNMTLVEEKAQQVTVPPDKYKDGCIIITLKEAIHGNFIGKENERYLDPSDFKNIPRMEPEEGRTLLSDLRDFFNHYKQLPYRLNRMDDESVYSINFYCPPYLSSLLYKMIMMSATLNRQHMIRAFPQEGVAFRETSPTPFQEGSELYQIDSGKYSVNSLLKHKDADFSKTGKRMIKQIEEKIKKDPENQYAIITSKRIIDRKQEDWDQIENINTLSHYGATEGLDHIFKGINRFIILGSYEIPPPEVLLRAKILNGQDEDPLSEERVQDDLGNYSYKDPRMQEAHDDITKAAITQSIGRARLNRHEDHKVYLFTSHKIGNYTDRAIFFDLTDLEQSNTFDDLKNIASNYRSEQKNQVDIVKSLFEESDYRINRNQVKERTGFSKTVIDRIYDRHIKEKVEIADQKLAEEIIHAYKNDLSKKQIRKQFKVSERKINSILSTIDKDG